MTTLRNAKIVAYLIAFIAGVMSHRRTSSPSASRLKAKPTPVAEVDEEIKAKRSAAARGRADPQGQRGALNTRWVASPARWSG